MGEYSSDSPQFICRDGVHAIPLFKYLTEKPLLFKADDNTMYSGYEVLLGNTSLEKYNQDQIIVLDWVGLNTDITQEARNAPGGKNTVQETLQLSLEQNSDYSIIIFDHGSGETADYITLKEDGAFIKVEFYHCKAMKGQNFNSDVSDVYEVAQQAVKSTIWIKSKTVLLDKLLSRIKGSNGTKFIRGDIKTLKELLKSQKFLDVSIYIVQPAISKSQPMKDSISTVLSAASFFIKNTGRAKILRIIGSA